MIDYYYCNSILLLLLLSSSFFLRITGPPPASQGVKFAVNEMCDRMKEEFNFLQAQYHSLKMECEKLAQEKTEMQRHYVMYYEMSYGLNAEMHKQIDERVGRRINQNTEIAKRLNNILLQIMNYLPQEHVSQVHAAIERAKQISATELNNLITYDLHAVMFSFFALSCSSANPSPNIDLAVEAENSQTKIKKRYANS
uniref:Groucho/TLE N-terminal Q-rich domain-containing protein n=1 Tax=Romanomermis culicivorax TaxID=13658 RepID=A0A915HWC5_ROMCU